MSISDRQPRVAEIRRRTRRSGVRRRHGLRRIAVRRHRRKTSLDVVGLDEAPADLGDALLERTLEGVDRFDQAVGVHPRAKLELAATTISPGPCWRVSTLSTRSTLGSISASSLNDCSILASAASPTS